MGSWSAIKIAAAALAAAGCTFEVQEQNLLFPWPNKLPPFSEEVVRRNLEVTATDGVTLRGWLLDVPDERFTLVYFYGNATSVIGSSVELYALAEHLHADVICLDYRGYGFSDGRPTMRQLGEDAVRIFDFAEWQAGGRPVVVMGTSLGSGAAVLVGARRNARAVVLVAPPASPDAIVQNMESRLPWYARVFFNLRPSARLRRLEPVPDNAIRSVEEPLLIVHGTADPVVPISHGYRLFHRAGSQRKFFCSIPGEDHSLSLFTVPRYRSCVTSFLRQEQAAGRR